MEPLEALIAKARRGDEAAFRELFVRHREGVARIVHRILGPSADLDDVVQDTFIHVYRSLPSFRGESKFSTWLYRLTTNVARMHLRKARSRPRIANVPVPETSEGTHGDGFGSIPDQVLERTERIQALYRLLDKLSDKKRTVILLHDFDGMSAQEIADVVVAPVLTVRTRLFYARKELYAAFAEEPSLAPLVALFADVLHGRSKPDGERKPEVDKKMEAPSAEPPEPRVRPAAKEASSR